MSNRAPLIVAFSLLPLACSEPEEPSSVGLSALTASHQVVAAYYPIFPRWMFDPAICPNERFIGDPVRQYPLFGLYNNRSNQEMNRFDFKAMANAGVTVINPHTFRSSVDYGLLDRIDRAASEAGVMWTPTFEALQGDPAALASATNDVIARYGSGHRLFQLGGRPIFFWYLHGPNVAAQAVAAAIEQVRAVHGPVVILLDEVCALGQPCQNGGGNGQISQWFRDADASTGERRVTGFYSWVSVFWAMSPDRRAWARNYVNTSRREGFLPVLSTSPSYNEEHWGYGTQGNNCGIGGDRSHQPRYNIERSTAEWSNNLDDLLADAGPGSWVYLQAYDEWGEGTTLAPTTRDCFDFLATLRTGLQQSGWMAEQGGYCRPEYPGGHAPTSCNTPICSGSPPTTNCTSGGAEPTNGGSSPNALFSFEAEGTGMGHLTGFRTNSGWRALASGCATDTFLVFGPYVDTLPTGLLTARFWLSVDNNTTDDGAIARIEVYDATSEQVLAERQLTRRQWSQVSAFQGFDLGFDSPGAGHRIELRTFYYGNAQLDEDKVEIIGAGAPPSNVPRSAPRTSGAIARYEAEEDLQHLTGSATSNSWRATTSDPNATFLAYGPYDQTLPAGDHTARFWLAVDNNTADARELVRIDVHDATAGVLLVERTIHRNDFSDADAHQAFDLAFRSQSGHRMEFRTYYFGHARIDLDLVEVLTTSLPPTTAIEVFEAENMMHLSGRPIPGGWRVGVQDPHDTYATYGPYADHLPGGDLTARFWLRVDNATADDSTICRIEVFDASAGQLLASSPITRRAWQQTGDYEPFELAFTNPTGHRLEFRTYYFWYARLDQDRVEIRR